MTSVAPAVPRWVFMVISPSKFEPKPFLHAGRSTRAARSTHFFMRRTLPEAEAEDHGRREALLWPDHAVLVEAPPLAVRHVEELPADDDAERRLVERLVVHLEDARLGHGVPLE